MVAIPTIVDVRADEKNTPAKRVRLVVSIILTIATAVILVFYLLAAINWWNSPFLGVMWSHQNVITTAEPIGQTRWSGLENGLEPGDRIIGIDGQSVGESGQSIDTVLSEQTRGETVTVTFTRMLSDDVGLADGVSCQANQSGAAVCETQVELGRMPDVDFLAYFLSPYVAALLCLFIAGTVVRLRPWDAATLSAVAIVLLMAIYIGGIFDVGSTHLMVPLWLSSAALLNGLLITFGLIFPTPLPFIYKRPWLRFIPILIGAALAIYLVLTYQSEPATPTGNTAVTAAVANIVGLLILGALILFYHRPNAVNTMARNQANLLLIGLAMASVPVILWTLGRFLQLITGDTFALVNVEPTMTFFVIPAFSIAYAVLQAPQRDTDQVISRGITYTIMFAALIIGYFLLVFGASLFTTGAVDTDNPLIIAIMVFFISLLFVPMRTYLEKRIDAVYFRTKMNYQALLEEFSQNLTSMTNIDAAIDAFRSLLHETVRPSNTLVFFRDEQREAYVAYGKDQQPDTDIFFTADSGIVSLLNNQNATIYLQAGRAWPSELFVDRTRIKILNVMVIAGMAGQEQLNGFVTLAPPQSGLNAYKYEELRFINNLVGQLGIALERAQAINSLERRVRELDVLSKVGQAVNFTIEVDDLLELISAQTLQLVRSPYFYIVLHDALTDQLYYAFFQENDERVRVNEHKKWSVGHDLLSEVLRSSQPKLVDDYARAMQQKRYEFHFENPEMRAWMGVPLIAGPRTLGVAAVGESDPDKKYSEDQLKVFSDIGALAATSLEKARLFTETNERARQLATLNDISQQLVATEGDIEKLLNLITSSAVDILNAEAGSLLLFAEDGTGQLEFKAAIGGTGHELIGTRLPSGRGIVGEVAQNGIPIISNDTSKDDFWEGEVAVDFQTNSILAVPLIAKGNTIGVLEVINKKDGSIYVEDDVELLTAFASQAAIAFENARLLRQTDLELTKRVQELETLERIDVELNRTLDLYKVAEITVRWAIANSGANAGVLGIVADDGVHMRIAYKYGYKEADLPEGLVDDDLWPIDVGIAKRVMRTRRPDLQPDVGIDPDYAPSLRGALSQITVPMLSGNEINALLILESNREPRLNLLDLFWVQRLAEHAAIAIANAQLYSELMRANASKSEFMGFASHELKTPLSSVKGYAEMLESGMLGDLSDQQRNFIGIIRSNADRMRLIIDDLRDIAKIDAEQLNVSPSPVSMWNVVMETLRSYQDQIDAKDQTVINNVREDLPLVAGDQPRLIQVLTNLISNANKYSPRGGTIRLEAAVRENFRDEKGNNYGSVLKVSVIDDGIGMQPEDLQKLFKVRYFRSEDEEAQKEKGTGLGMMITHSIIRQHGGTIWAESEWRQGTTFNFVIPLATEEEPEEEPPTAEPASD